jgi:hypothetical protein
MVEFDYRGWIEWVELLVLNVALLITFLVESWQWLDHKVGITNFFRKRKKRRLKTISSTSSEVSLRKSRRQ